MANATKKTVIVTGDVTMDWNIAQERNRDGIEWNVDRCSRVWWQRGGAALQADLLRSVLTSLEESHKLTFQIYEPPTPHEPVQHGDVRFNHYYTLWSPYKSEKKDVWRVEQFLGMDRCPSSAPDTDATWHVIVDDRPDADLVVLDDADLGFRDRPELWPLAIQDPSHKPWIILKMAKPVARGPLWDHLLEHFTDRLITITTIADLRQTEVQISRQLSWERTAQDVVWELTHNPRVNALSRCAHAIVSMNAAGSIMLSTTPDGPQQTMLFFDPRAMEGDWERGVPGYIFGYTSCLTASIARQVLLDAASPDLHAGIQGGIHAMRTLHLEGYGIPDTSPEDAKLRFPLEKVTQSLAENATPLSSAPIQDPVQYLLAVPETGTARVAPGFWTILEDRYTGSLSELAQRIVLDGYRTSLKDVPIGKFGALVTVDRREIEALHSMQSLIFEYAERPQKRPLTIAVFGPPGSGKSFAVTQIAKNARPGEIAVLSFNISQFGHPDDLLDALHQVRDVGLSGKLPLVFWDEFDTPLGETRLGWLRYFLAPMQDGAFQEGQIIHPIGRAIFVFAGGTSHRMQEFGADLEQREARAVKLPDFISRLKGYLNVLGPNPIAGETDPYYIIRRALILRVLFELNVPQIIHEDGGARRVDIDRGILRAFLEARRYKHGVRSIETIITMSMLAGQHSFERSNLPPENQLDLHVDGLEFLSLVQQMNLQGDLLEKLAEAAHEVFSEGLFARGYQYGPDTDEAKKTHRELLPYADLSEDIKESNRNNVRDIPNKLTIAGYVMVPARSNEPPFDFPGDDLEALARLEHERWMRDKLETGWSHAAVTDKAAKLHQALVDWEQLPESEKEKDREMVRGIPRILAKAGYAIVKS
jgi:hypothetical protein